MKVWGGKAKVWGGKAMVWGGKAKVWGGKEKGWGGKAMVWDTDGRARPVEGPHGDLEAGALGQQHVVLRDPHVLEGDAARVRAALPHVQLLPHGGGDGGCRHQNRTPPPLKHPPKTPRSSEGAAGQRDPEITRLWGGGEL